MSGKDECALSTVNQRNVVDDNGNAFSSSNGTVNNNNNNSTTNNNSLFSKMKSAGQRFNEHTRKLRRFSRTAAIYSWIEPTALVVSAFIHYMLYSNDIVTNLLYLIPMCLILAEIFMVAFSLVILLVQALKASRQEAHTIADIRVASRPPSPTNGTSSNDNNSDDTKQTEPIRKSKCQSFTPPQVVRWDIIGVTLSSWFGKVNSIPLPHFLRVPLYRLYSAYFNVNLDEIKLPLKSFACMQDFFTRELKPGVRPIDPNAPIVSPVDAKMSINGLVTGDSVEQVKGVTYKIPSFLGEDTWEKIKDKKIYQCVLYLAPGDYHRIHSATNWVLNHLRHFPGTLFPISPIVARLVPNLFALNERVVLTGEWEHGFFSSTAVGAYHVGSMAFNFDQQVRTNKIRRDFTNPNLSYLTTRDLGAYAYHFDYPNGQLSFGPGDEMGTFKLGSTIVLFFEVPQDKDFVFDVEPGQKVKLGQSLGHFVDAKK